MLIDHSLFTFKFQYELYVLICLFESGLFKADNRFCSSQHVLYNFYFFLKSFLADGVQIAGLAQMNLVWNAADH